MLKRFYLIDKREPILTYIAVPERKISLKWREKRPLCPKFMACPTYALVPNLHLERHQSAVSMHAVLCGHPDHFLNYLFVVLYDRL